MLPEIFRGEMNELILSRVTVITNVSPMKLGQNMHSSHLLPKLDAFTDNSHVALLFSMSFETAKRAFPHEVTTSGKGMFLLV
jgi:hypothetical protein